MVPSAVEQDRRFLDLLRDVFRMDRILRDADVCDWFRADAESEDIRAAGHEMERRVDVGAGVEIEMCEPGDLALRISHVHFGDGQARALSGIGETAGRNGPRQIDHVKHETSRASLFGLGRSHRTPARGSTPQSR